MMASTSDATFLKCSLCSQVFTSKPDLSEHMSLHLANKKYSCTLCGKKFFNEKSLELHISIHATEIKYEAMSSSSEEQMILTDHIDNFISDNQGNKVPQVKVRVKSFPANTALVNESQLKNLDGDQMHFQLTDEEFGVIEESEVYTTRGEVFQEKKPVHLKVWSKDQNYKPTADAVPSKTPYVIKVMEKNPEGQTQRVVESDVFRSNENQSQLPIRIFVGNNIRLENLEDLQNFTSLGEDFKVEDLSPVNIGHEQNYEFASYGETTYQEETQQNQPLHGIKEDLQSLQQVIEGDLQSLQEELGAEDLKSLEETMVNESLQPSERVIDDANVKLPQKHKEPLMPQIGLGRELEVPITDPAENQSAHMFVSKSDQLTQGKINDSSAQSSQCQFDENVQSTQKHDHSTSQTSLKEICSLPLSEVNDEAHEAAWEDTENIQSLNGEECLSREPLYSQTADDTVPNNKDEIPIIIKTKSDPVPDLKKENIRFSRANDEVTRSSTTAEPLYTVNDAKEFKRKVMQSSKRPHRCKVCGLGFRFAFYLKAHQTIHLRDNVQYSCGICGKGFKTMDAYEKHQQIHEDPITFECLDCMKKLDSEYQLKKHMQLHKQLKQHECYVCHEEFNTNRLLRLHLKSHKINKCYICDKVFKESSKLKRHLTSHLNKKLHDCESCGRTLYCLPVDFERHKMMHQNLLTCPDCFEELPFQDFQRHKQTCSGTMQCSVTYNEDCGKKRTVYAKDGFDVNEDDNMLRSRIAEQLIDDLLHDMSIEDMQGKPFLRDTEDWLERTSDGVTKEKLKDCILLCTTKSDVLRELSLYSENDLIKDAISDCLLRERVAVQQLSRLLIDNEKIITPKSVGQKRKRGGTK